MKIYIIFLFFIFNVKFATSWQKYRNLKHYFHSGFWEYCSPFSKEKPPQSVKSFSSYQYELSGFVFHPDEFINLIDTVKSLNCTFNIKAPSGKKLFANVQSMKFDCSDSIEFKTDDNVIKGPYCGNFQQNNKDTNTLSLDNDYYKHDKFGVYSNNGEIQMTIFFSEKSIQQKYYDDLVVVFTTYMNFNEDVIEEMSINLSRVDDVYLKKEFICDGIENCPDQICNDEKNCDDIVVKNVFIVEIILIIILFIISIVFYFWKLRKRLCRTTEQNDLCDGRIYPRSFLNHQVSVISAPTNCPLNDPPPTYESLYEKQSASSSNDDNESSNR